MPATILFLGLMVTTPLGRCEPARVAADPSALVARAIDATRMRTGDRRVLRIRSQLVRELRDLSDRSIAPFDASIMEEDIWFDPLSGVEGVRFGGPASPMLWSAPTVTLVGVDSLRPAPPALHGFARWQRAFDAWAVLAEWETRRDAVLDGRCVYRGYHVNALRRPDGSRLLLNEDDGLPVALFRTEFSYFLGPEAVEYRYFNWEHLRTATLPLSSMRVVDGKRDRLRTLHVGRDGTELVARDSAPAMPRVAGYAAMADTLVTPPEPFWSTDPPDTVRVGPSSFLLVGAAFTSAVALAADTVFILDATQGERRARQDSVWIGKLFPGRHPLAFLVSTDIWPHIAGLRYWAAIGARLIVHPVTRSVVDSALARRWTSKPDLFERRRASVRPKVDTVRSPQSRAGGALQLFAIDGVSSEGVLGAYLATDGFVWASDRVQDLGAPSVYVTELWQAVHRNHFSPTTTSGPHLRVVPWSSIEALARK